MDLKQCAACRQKFQPHPHTPRQKFCSAPKCQRERRRRGQRNTRKKDPDYKDNQVRAQQAWNKRNSSYWREYRRAHPEYIERNQLLQRERSYKRKMKLIAKTGVSPLDTPVPSGIYRLVPVAQTGIAKMDVWTLEIKFLSNTYNQKPVIAKRGRDG